jgi:hypothetical protein
MKQIWDTTEKHILEFKEELEKLIENLPKSAKFHQQTATINKLWKKVQTSLNEMDQYITPVKSIEVKCKLLEDTSFTQSWNFWKDYLNEQHGIFMRSRAELMSLKRMMELSDNNAQNAIRYLEFAMGRMDKNFYKVNETEEPKKPDTANAKTFVLKLPEKYNTPKADPLEGLTK